MALVFGLAYSIENLLDDMVTRVVMHHGDTRDAAVLWEWDRLHRAHESVGRMQWDDHIAHIRASEIGFGRAGQSLLGGGRPNPLPDYTEVHEDPFSPPKVKALSERWQLYLANNNIEKW